MIAQAKVRQIAGDVAKANLSRSNVETVESEDAVDSEGRDALRITIVVKPGTAEKFDGEKLLDTLVQIQERLRREGEERFATVEYATKEELEERGDT